MCGIIYIVVYRVVLLLFLEIRDHPFLTGTSLDEFRSKYPGKNVRIIFCAMCLLPAVFRECIAVFSKLLFAYIS